MKIVLIDGKNFCYRMHYTHIGLSANRQPTGVIYGCLTGMLNLAKRLPDTAFVYVWDGNGKTWRHELATAIYKANRPQSAEEMDEAHLDVHVQIPVLKKMLSKMGFRQFEIPRLEGDDLVGMLAKFLDYQSWFEKVIIYSTDRDFYQLLSPKISVLRGIDRNNSEKLIWAHPKDIQEEFGIPVEKYTHLRAITGDPSDNIPQIFRGVGPKTAIKFIEAGCNPSIEKFEDLPKKVKKNLEITYVIRKNQVNFKKNWDKIHLNWKLSKIVCGIDSPYLHPEVREQVKTLLQSLDRKSFLREIPEEGWDYMTMALRRMEMEELHGRRQELWALP